MVGTELRGTEKKERGAVAPRSRDAILDGDQAAAYIVARLRTTSSRPWQASST